MDAFLIHWQAFYRNLVSPSLSNSFYFLVFVSALFFLLEILFPWRKEQKILRKDFWLDGFYMFFNMSIFPLLGFAFFAGVVYAQFLLLLNWFGIHSIIVISLKGWPYWLQLLLMFVVRDFVQWNTHRLLHRIPLLWEFHKVHHSIEQMGFAGHLRYHWTENVIYRLLEFLPLAMLGFTISDFTVIYFTSLAIGHFNHANIHVPLGPLKYVFNNPQMHIWHHARSIPNKYGVNFGLSLSIWDYVFKTAYVPKSGRDTPLGFENIEDFPSSFWRQLVYPWGGGRNSRMTR